MRAIVLAGVGDVRLEDVPEPVLEEPGDAVVLVEVAGLCGSDLHPYSGREPARFGVVQGHEAVGRVAEVGPDVTAFAAGDRVIVPFTTSCGRCRPCRTGLSSRCETGRLFGWGDPSGATPPLHGAQAERLRVPMADGTLVRIPDSFDQDTALLMSDNFPTAWYALARAGWASGTLAVIGLGAVGLCVVAAAVSRGTGAVLAIDPVPERRDAARRLGPGITVAAPGEVERVTVGDITAAVEAAGPPEAQRLAAALVLPGSTISIIAVQTSAAFGIDPVSAYDRNLTISTGRAPVRSILDALIEGVANGSVRVPARTVITHPDRPLAEGPDLYRRFAGREDGLVKVTLCP